MILRHILKKDLAVVASMLQPWIDRNPRIPGILEDLAGAGFMEKTQHCSIMEVDGAVHCVCLWIRETIGEVQILALESSGPGDDSSTARFLREQVLEWAAIEVHKVRISIPQTQVSRMIDGLQSCGFVFEGMFCSLEPAIRPVVHFCKHFLYRALPHSQVVDFLRDFLVVLGYEIRTEKEGFGYRIRPEFRLPFVFSPWHRVTQSAADIIVHPPARVLEAYELETLFFPLRILGEKEKPLLLTIDARRAGDLIDLPDEALGQNSLFGPMTFCRPRSVHLTDITCTHPSALSGLRKGLPLLFYVNGMGAVGTARVEDWDLDEPETLYTKTNQLASSDLDELRDHSAASGSLAGKVLIIRFQWYRPFKKTVSLDEIRAMDEGFNPQRTRTLSQELYQSIVLSGSAPD